MVVGGLETGAFPAIEFSLEAYDGQGNFVSDLTSSDLVLTEDGQPVNGAVLEMEEPGLQFSVAINPGPQLATAIGGKPQIDLLRSALADWARRQPGTSGSDFSFATNTGLQVIRSRDTAQWSEAFADFQPNLTQGELNLFSLTTVLDLASDQEVDPRHETRDSLHHPTGVNRPGFQPGRSDQPRAAGGGAGFRLGHRDGFEFFQPAGHVRAAVAGAKYRREVYPGRRCGDHPRPGELAGPAAQIYRVKFLSKVQQSGQHRLGVQLKRDELTTLEQVLYLFARAETAQPDLPLATLACGARLDGG